MDSRKHKQQGLCECGFRLHRREQFRAAVDYVVSQFQTDLSAPSGALRIGRTVGDRSGPQVEHTAASASLRTLVSPLG
jgi:hypothetical protein